MHNWIKNVTESNKRIAIPVMTHPGIELIKKTVFDAVTDINIHYEAVRAINEKYTSAACTLIMDLTVEAEAFGANIVFPCDEIPSVVDRLIPDLEAINSLTLPDLTTKRIPEFLSVNRLLAENITDKPVFGGCIGPFSLAGRLFDLSELMIACCTEPEFVVEILDKCTQFLKLYSSAIKKTGVNGLFIAEPAAGLLSNAFCKEFSSKYIKQIINIVQDENFMVILHNCGNTGHCNEAMFETEALAYHFGNKSDMQIALQQCSPDKLVMGNIDPVNILKLGDKNEVYTHTLDLLNRTAGFSNFVLSTGCDVPPHVPHDNIYAFYKALEDFNNN